MIWKQAFRNLIASPLRTFLTSLSVVLGVAFVVGAFVLGDMINSAFSEIFDTANRGVDVRVQGAEVEQDGNLEERFDRSTLEAVAAVPGVESVAGGLFTDQVAIIDKDGEPIGGGGPPQFGGSWVENEDLNAFSVVEGKAPSGPDEIVIDVGSADEGNLDVGDRVRVAADGPAETFTVVGLIEFGSGLKGATFAVWDLPRATELLGAEGELRFVTAKAEAGVSLAVLRDRVADVIPPNAVALTGEQAAEQQAADVQEGIGIFRNFLLGFAAIALLVSTFVIFNVFSITVAQRTRQLGLLRSVGSSAGQIRSMVVLEALFIGVLASILGLFAGLGIAQGLVALFKAIDIALPTNSPELLPRTVMWAFTVGLIVTLVAALVPAIRASRISPIEAMRESSAEDSRVGLKAKIFGIGLPLAGVGLLAWGLWGSLDLQPRIVLMAIGALFIFIGAAVLIMLIARPLVAVIGAPARRISGVSGKLASENVVRKPSRTAASAAALTIGVALVAFFAIFTTSLRASLFDTLDNQFRADYIAFINDDSNSAFSAELADRLEAAPEIGVVTRWRAGDFLNATELPAPDAEGISSDELIAVEPDKLLKIYDPELLRGNIAELTGDTVMVQRSAAEDRGIDVGDELPMVFEKTGAKRFRVVGIYDDTTWSDYFISLETYGQNFAQVDDNYVLARAAEGVALDAANEEFATIAQDFPQVNAQTNQEFRDEQESQLNQLLGIVYAMLGLAIIIAVLGIIATLFLAIFERTREIGLLRAVGLSRKQTGAMVRWESIMTALIGSLVGIVIGVVLAVLIVKRLGDDIPVLDIPIPTLLIVLVIAALVGVVASILPARRAARMNILKAIQTE